MSSEETGDRPGALPGLHTYAEDFVQLMLSTVRRRMANGPLPLGSPGGQAELKKALDGVIGPVGRDPRDVLRIYEEVLEPTFVAMDNPTFSHSSRERPVRPRHCSTCWSPASPCEV